MLQGEFWRRVEILGMFRVEVVVFLVCANIDVGFGVVGQLLTSAGER
jgi:hypothetical protein